MKRVLSLGLAVLLWAALVVGSQAAAPLVYEPLPGPVPSGEPRFVDREEMEQFMDALMEKAFGDYRLVGAVVGVVVDGQPFFAKGYGHADLEKKEPVDAGSTLFRLGSASSLFTWTAAMQLIGEGALDPEADVNDLLAKSPANLAFPKPQKATTDAPVPSTHRAFEEPITLRNLMTHSAGLEEWISGGHFYGKSAETGESLAQALARWKPARFVPPTTDFGHDRVSLYSSWGTALAGHLVELASAQSFDDYVAAKIFKPLGMTHTTFLEAPAFDLPDGSRFALPYQFREASFHALPQEHLRRFAPAVSASSTAEDMMRFAIAHLKTSELLPAEASAAMHARSLAINRHTNGQTLGFSEVYTHGRRTLSQAGSSLYFHSDLTLIPETGTAFFIAFNTPEGRAARGAVKKAFLDRYFPADFSRPKPVEPPGTRDALFAGLYRPAALNGHSPDKLLSFASDVKVSQHRPGVVLIQGLDGRRDEWVEIDKGIVQNPETGALATFTFNEEGGVERLTGAEVNHPLVKLRWMETGDFHRKLVIVCGVIFLTLLPRLLFGRGALRRLLLMVGLLQAGAVALAAPWLTTRANELLTGTPVALRLAQGFFCFSLAFWLLAALLLLLTLLTARGTLAARLHLLLGFLAGGAILWSAHLWNLLRVPLLS